MQAAWEKLHTGCWKDVEPAWRDAYALACLLRALVRLSRLHVSPPAVSEPLCSAAASESLLVVSASQFKHQQQTGEQVETYDRIHSIDEQHAELECPVAQSLRGSQHPTSTLQCRQVPREGAGKPGCTLTISEQHTETHEGDPGSSAGHAVKAAMRELDLGIMMGGHTYQDSLHAAVAIAQKAWSKCSEAGNPDACQQHPMSHPSSACEQSNHKQAERGEKRKRPTHEACPGEGASSRPTDGLNCSAVPEAGQKSKAAAAWAPAELSSERLCELQQLLPPGAPHANPRPIASRSGRLVGLSLLPDAHNDLFPCLLSVLDVTWVLALQDPWAAEEFPLSISRPLTAFLSSTCAPGHTASHAE